MSCIVERFFVAESGFVKRLLAGVELGGFE